MAWLLFQMNIPSSRQYQFYQATIKVFVGPGGPYKIADLKNVDETWSFDYTFLNRGVNRPFTFQAYNSSGNLLQEIYRKLTIK